MVKNLYDHFEVLYSSILFDNPTLASEHALRQEDEVYKKSSKITYRNVRFYHDTELCPLISPQAVITSIAALKRRPKPDSISHHSVGTEGDLQVRAESRKSLDSLRLTRSHLESLVMSVTDMQKCGYVVDVPGGPGGDKPTQEGALANCERCSSPFQISGMQLRDACLHHWGRPYSKTINGEFYPVFLVGALELCGHRGEDANIQVLFKNCITGRGMCERPSHFL
jgi:RNA exonuclease 1